MVVLIVFHLSPFEIMMLFCQFVVFLLLTIYYNSLFPSVIQVATELDGQTVAMSTSSLRRQVKNIVHNYSEAEIKVVCPSAYMAFLFHSHIPYMSMV